MLKFTIALLAVCFAAAPGRASDEIVIEGAVLSHIEHADVPAPEAGRLNALLVREGDQVSVGQPLGRVDDEQVRLAHRRSVLEYEAAKSLADDMSRVDSFRKTAEKERQLLAELEIDLNVADKESKNDVAVRAAEKAMEVAHNQFQRMSRSREKFKDSVSQAELEGAKLTFEKATLEHEQAGFDLSMKRERLAGKQAALVTQKLAIEEADLKVRQEMELHQIAVLQAGLKQHDIEIASLAVSRRQVTSPIDGVIVERYRQPGEWVEPGEKVIRLIRLNRLRAEGFLPLAQAVSLSGSKALIEVTTPDQNVVTKTARISFVSPEVDAINTEVRVWAEFDNEEPRLSPGMRARVRIAVPGQAESAAAAHQDRR